MFPMTLMFDPHHHVKLQPFSRRTRILMSELVRLSAGRLIHEVGDRAAEYSSLIIH